MDLRALLEPEELVGGAWHRLVGNGASWPHFPDAAVTLEQVRPALSVFFRGLGGAAGLKLAAATAETSRHRLSLRLRLGMGEERLVRSRRDTTALYLPEFIEAFPDAARNHDLYLWLAAFLAHAVEIPDATDALHRDLLFLRAARQTTDAVLARLPGLRSLHAVLVAELLALRPRRRLPPAETAVEQAVQRLLGGEGDGGAWWGAVEGRGVPLPHPPAHYRPFLPVPLWGEVVAGTAAAPAAVAGDAGGTGTDSGDERVRKATRRRSDRAQRNDSFILNRMEKLLSLIEHMNINRAVDDDDDEGARRALDDAEEIGLSAHARRPATRLKFDLDLPPTDADTAALTAELTYPEWDHARRLYHRDHCRVLAGPASESGEAWEPDAAAWRRIQRVRRQFEALRTCPETLRAQIDGAELDIEAVVRARADLAGSGEGSDRVHLAARRQARDLSVALLVDRSLSTDAWIDNRRVLDIAKESLLVLAYGLAACGDEHAILTFTSRRRSWVKVDTVKGFGEAFGPAVQRRIASLKPGFYTRMGAAIRHASAQLRERPHRHRLLLLVTDGKPNDIDHYEGRYGAEDTAQAVREARRNGIAVFGVTIDRKAQAYFPLIFGRGGYAMIGNAARLPLALPALYRHLVAR